MLPPLPRKIPPDLEELALRVIAGSAALGRGIHPRITDAIARLMTKVNSYYTNAMEGNPSKLHDIDKALRKDLAKDEDARSHQLEHIAHIKVQEEMMARLSKEPNLDICSQEFLCWLHERFFSELPEKMRFGKTETNKRIPIIPGALRDRGATVGIHEGPVTQGEIETCLNKFAALLSPARLTGSRKVLAMASSHHRFLWIHPFPEGNGRVARLLTTAYGYRIGVGDNMLWTVTRAFGRDRQKYDAHLAMADRPRRNDLDGRGPLSEEDLTAFCRYFLLCCEDQISYMSELLQLSDFERRYNRFIDRLVLEKHSSKAGAKIMKNLLRYGEIPRSEVPDICRVRQRRATQIIKELLDAGMAYSASSYGPLRLTIDTDMASAVFPALT